MVKITALYQQAEGCGRSAAADEELLAPVPGSTAASAVVIGALADEPPLERPAGRGARRDTRGRVWSPRPSDPPTRRKYQSYGTLVLLITGLSLLCAAAWAEEKTSPPPQADVFLAENPAAVRGGGVDEIAVRRMVDGVVMAAAGRTDPASAWRVFVQPQDRVGLKVSASGAPVSSTHPAVIAAVAEGVVSAGVAPKHIVIWDRKWEDLSRAGYGALGQRYVVASTDRSGGYDEGETVTAAVMGKLIVGDREFDMEGAGDQTSSKSHLSSVLGSVDKVIHLPALTDHLSSGVNGAISGMVLDNLDNWRRLARAPHFGDPFLPELYADPRIGGKVVLTIIDALRPQYGGGPFPEPQYSVNHGAIYASRDPVAIDALGLQLLDQLRARGGLPPLSKQIEWIKSAEIIGLGTAAPDRIRVIPTHSLP